LKKKKKKKREEKNTDYFQSAEKKSGRGTQGWEKTDTPKKVSDQGGTAQTHSARTD